MRGGRVTEQKLRQLLLYINLTTLLTTYLLMTDLQHYHMISEHHTTIFQRELVSSPLVGDEVLVSSVALPREDSFSYSR